MMFLLAFTQLFLLLFCFGLARELYFLKRLHIQDNWPSDTLEPGDRLPVAVMRVLNREAMSPKGTIMLCAVNTNGLDQMFTSLAFVCQLWRREPLILCDSGHLASCYNLPVKHTQVIRVVPHLGREMGLSLNTIMFIKGAKLVEASAQSKTPSEIRARFAFVGEP